MVEVLTEAVVVAAAATVSDAPCRLEALKSAVPL